MTTKVKAERFTGITPKGICIFPKLTVPDFGTEQYPDPAGHYKVTLRIPEDDAKPLIERLDKIYDDWITECDAKFKPTPKVKKFTVNEPPWNVAMNKDRDTGEWHEVPGFYDFRCKTVSSYTDKKTKEVKKIKLDYFTAFNEKITKPPEIWGGSIVRLAYEASPYSATIGAGISLRINAVQIIQLNSGFNRTATQYGFEADEAGFSYKDMADEADSAEDFNEKNEAEDF